MSEIIKLSEYDKIKRYKSLGDLIDSEFYTALKTPYVSIIGQPASGKTFFIRKLVKFLLKSEPNSIILFLKRNNEDGDTDLAKNKNIRIIYFNQIEGKKFSLIDKLLARNNKRKNRFKFNIIFDDYNSITDKKNKLAIKDLQYKLACDRRHTEAAVYSLSQIFKNYDNQMKTNFNVFLFAIPISNLNSEDIFKNYMVDLKDIKDKINKTENKHYFLGFNANSNESFIVDKFIE